MAFTFVGIIVISVCIISFFILLKNVKKLFNWFFSLTVIATVFFDIGYVCKIGDFIVEYNYLFTLMTFISAILYFLFYKIHSGGHKYFLLLILIIFVNLFLKALLKIEYLSADFNTVWDNLFIDKKLLTVSVSKDVLNTIIRFLLFGVIVFAFIQSSSEIEINYITSKVYLCSKIYLAYILAELILLNIFDTNIMRETSYKLFGQTEFSFADPRNFLFLKAPIGIAREPSNLALSILYISIFSLYNFIKTGKGKSVIFLYALIAIIIGSFSAFLHLCTLAFVIFLSLKKKTQRYIIAILPVLALGFVVLILKIDLDRITEFLNYFPYFKEGIGSLPQSSSVIRFFSIYNNFGYFIKYPLFGTGLGTIYSFSPMVTLITNLGIIGSVLFFKFYFDSISSVFNIKKIKVYIILPVLLFSFTFTGHLGYLLYFEKTFVLFIVILLIYKAKREGKKA